MRKLIVLSVLLSILSLFSCEKSKSAPVSSQENIYSSTGYTYKNMTIFPIQRKDELSRNYLTLEDAMNQNKIILHETGSVDELSVDNLSLEYVFIMAGDIVKGGRQDRTIGEDIVLPPDTKNIPLKSFCVEQSRWSGRGFESTAVFSSSEKTLNNKALKVAARTEKDQLKVWDEVANYQNNVSKKAQVEVRNSASPSSLQLTLENDKIKSSIDEYVNALQPAFDGKNDVLGFAFFINGKISTVEIFGNAALFKKLQKKLLEAAAFEAFEKYDEKLEFSIPEPTILNKFIEAAEKGTETDRRTFTDMIEYTIKTNDSILLRSVNTDAGMSALRTSIYSTEDLSMDEGNSAYSHGNIVVE